MWWTSFFEVDLPMPNTESVTMHRSDIPFTAPRGLATIRERIIINGFSFGYSPFSFDIQCQGAAAKTDFGNHCRHYDSQHSRKMGAFPIMQPQFRRALGSMIARGQAQHLLKRRHYARFRLCLVVAELHPRGIWSVPAVEEW